MHTIVARNKNGANLNLKVLAGKSAIPGFLSCMLSVYSRKGNYANHLMMDKKWLTAQADAGNLLIFAFADQDGECAVSMVAVKNAKFDGMIDLSSLVVNPKYRGFRLGDLMTEYILRQCEDEGFDFIHSPIVTHHKRTGEMYERHGFTPTGFLFGDCDAKKHLAELELSSQKLSLAVYMRNRGENRAVNVFIPESLVPLAKDIYEPLGTTLNIDHRERIPAAGCDLEHVQDEYHNSLFMYLWKGGMGLRFRIDELETRYTNTLQTYFIYLNIRDPHAINAYKVLTSMGYKFCGFKPLCGSDEFIIMSKVHETLIDAAELQMSDALTKLFERVTGH